MADRYWVGGTGTWDTNVGSKWSTTSGGTGGASVPTSADDVFFDANSGSDTVTVSGTRLCKSITCTGFTGTLTSVNTTGRLHVYGDVTLSAGMTYSVLGNLEIHGGVTSTITTFGKLIPYLRTDGLSDNTITLGDNLTANRIKINSSTPGVNNSFNLNGHIIQQLDRLQETSFDGKSLTIGSGELNVFGEWNVSSETTVASHTGVIFMITEVDDQFVIFRGGGKTYNAVYFIGFSGVQHTGCTLSIEGSNTFTVLDTSLTGTKTFRFQAGTTQTITTFEPLTNATLTSSTSAKASLIKAGGGTVTVQSATITNVDVLPANTWIALSSTLTNSSGWVTGTPTVITVDVSTVTKTDATVSSSVTNTQGGDVLSRGFVYSTTSQPAPGNVAPASSGYANNLTESGTFGVGGFSQPITSLSAATTYYIRAFAQNVAGYTYSDEFNFTTRRYDGELMTNQTTTQSAIINNTTTPTAITNL